MANLPYNIATPLVADLLDDVPPITRMLVMVQLEVAERLCARPRTPAYGAVSVKVAYWAEARLVGKVRPTVFLPRPNVESGLVEIVRRPAPAVGEEARAVVRPASNRVPATPQDAAPVTARACAARRLRRGRHRRRCPPRGARRRRLGSPHRHDARLSRRDPSYLPNIASAVRIGTPSDRAWAMRSRSNGSPWWWGRCATARACECSTATGVPPMNPGPAHSDPAVLAVATALGRAQCDLT